MTVQDNDPFFQSDYMHPNTSAADLIHNELIARTMASLGAVVRVDELTPPGTPADLDAYIIKPTNVDPVGPAAGEWSGNEGLIAVFLGGWIYLNPKPGMKLWVINGPAGQAGRYIEYQTNGWSSLGGQQNLTVFDAGAGQWEADWDLKYGDTARLTLNQSTVTLNSPSNIRYGRKLVLIVKQGVGNQALALKAGNFIAPGGVITQPTQAVNAETVYTFIHPGPSHVGPMLLQTALNMQTV